MNQHRLGPLKFEPIFKDKIWGGQKIKSILNKDFGELPNCGESWELSGVQDNFSVVANGPYKGVTLPDLIDQYRGQLVGEGVFEQFGSTFPLLVKFIDANDDLSIQVHPGDREAMTRHNCFGKTEMWYVLQADEKSSLISGFKKEVSEDEFAEYSHSSKVLEVLNKEEVNEGDAYFLPAGRVHSIGKGLLIAEIQQTSDITYRVYDFDRTDQQGNKRELHIEDAVGVIDYRIHEQYHTPYQDKVNNKVSLVSCEYFAVNKIWADQEFNWECSDLDSFIIYVCVGGKGTINGLEIRTGETILIPAGTGEVSIIPDGDIKLLESFVSA